MKAQVTGLNEIQSRLAEIGQTAASKVMRPAVTAGAKLVNKTAKRTVARNTKLLQKSIGQKVKTYRQSGVVVGIVGPRKDVRTADQNPVKYAHIVERGRKGVTVRRKRVLANAARVFGKHVRPAAAQPFLAPALRDPAVSAAVIAEAKARVASLGS